MLRPTTIVLWSTSPRVQETGIMEGMQKPTIVVSAHWRITVRLSDSSRILLTLTTNALLYIRKGEKQKKLLRTFRRLWIYRRGPREVKKRRKIERRRFSFPAKINYFLRLESERFTR